MMTTSWTEAPAGTPAPGLVVRPRDGVPAGHRAVDGSSEVSPRASEAFTPPFQGTGLPFGGTVIPAAVQQGARDGTVTDNVHTDAITLGIHSSGRPPS